MVQAGALGRAISKYPGAARTGLTDGKSKFKKPPVGIPVPGVAR
jgi:hypothetical protein